MTHGTISPLDSHNQKLLDNVHPADWQNPEPAEKYNLVVIGAGVGGLVSAAGAAGLGAKVALIERHLMGGDCLNVGCVPSKALIASAHARAAFREAAALGVDGEYQGTRFADVMARMREVRAGIAPHDSVERFSDLGIDVFLGDGKFIDENTIEVDGQQLKFHRAVIATGARAGIPPVPGLAEAKPLTNETVFELTELPERLAVVGGGPIGAELAQCFARFGSQITLLDRGSQIMTKEEPDAAKIVQEALLEDGVELVLNADLQSVSSNDGQHALSYVSNGESAEITVDAILVAAGRVPNVESLGLEQAGVEFTSKGVTVTDQLRTSNKKVYAVGDVCMAWQFTHAADAAARIVIQNAFFPGNKKLSDLVMPWCTYTDPEVAQVGLTPKAAAEQGIEIETFSEPFSNVDRALADNETNGFCRVHVKKGSDKIVGATIVGRQAGDMINELTFAMTHDIGLGGIASTIHPYPSRGEAIKHVGDAYNRTRLTPLVSKLFAWWFGLFR